MPVMHMMLFHPASDYEGRAPLEAATRAISGWLELRVGGGVAPDVEHLLAFQLERAEQWARIDAASFFPVEEKRRMAGVGE